jgi:hypothetical protein
VDWNPRLPIRISYDVSFKTGKIGFVLYWYLKPVQRILLPGAADSNPLIHFMNINAWIGIPASRNKFLKVFVVTINIHTDL